MSDGTTYSGNCIVVPPGTNVTLILTFQTHFLPLVRWMFTNLNNVTMEIDFVNNPRFKISLHILIDVTNGIYQVMNECINGRTEVDFVLMDGCSMCNILDSIM